MNIKGFIKGYLLSVIITLVLVLIYTSLIYFKIISDYFIYPYLLSFISYLLFGFIFASLFKTKRLLKAFSFMIINIIIIELLKLILNIDFNYLKLMINILAYLTSTSFYFILKTKHC